MSQNTPGGDTPASSASGAISWIEAVSYTAVIGLIAAMASGLFDSMVPWR
jgi:hypothetical protein